MSDKNVISVQHLSKMYKLYDKPSDRLKESLGLSRKKKYREHYALHDVNFNIHRRRMCRDHRSERFREVHDP